MKYFFSIFIFAFINISHADTLSNLILSDTEMKKLQRYFPADDSTHLIWDGTPIAVALPVGKEKRLIFPANVTADVNGALNADQLKLLNNDKSLYFTALKPFQTTRIYVTLKTTGEVLLIDLSTEEHTSNVSQYIDMHQKLIKTNDTTTDSSEKNKSNAYKDVTYVDLIRFAWKQTYAPERISKNAPQYSRAPMHTQKFVSWLVYGDNIIAFPQGSWMAGKYYITAILLRNKYQHITRIDLRNDLCGEWKAATLFPRSILKPYGDKEKDTTMLFLVSSRPLGENLGVCHGNA